MAEKPSVKGALVAEAIEKGRKFLEEGRLSREELAASLRPEDLETFDEPTNVAMWYELEFYRRLAELLHEVEGGPREEYFRKQGFLRGQKLIDGGLYQQMEYVDRSQVAREMDPEARFEAYGRDLKLFVTLSGAILNFTRWSVGRDPDHDDRYRIEVRGATDFPDFLGWGSEGLINAMAASQGLADLWRYQRVSPDFVVFRMLRPV
ncbi:MAG: hypothetical protein ACYTAF_14270 [Planctomycetota bacterium]